MTTSDTRAQVESRPSGPVPSQNAANQALAQGLSVIIGLIYEAASDAQAWPRLLKAIGELIALEGCHEELILACLAPHFFRSYAMHQELRELEAERDLLERLMDRLPFGAAILDRQAKAISLNSAMVRVIQRNPQLVLETGYLLSEPPEDLTIAIAQALDGRQEGVFLRLPIAVADHIDDTADSHSLTIWLSALGSTKGPGRVVVLAGNPEQRNLSIQGLVTYFGLSQAQARLTQQMAQGQNAEEAAVALGISHNTAKTQLKKIFAKFGIQRQSQLIKAIYDTPLPLGVASSASTDGLTPRSWRLHSLFTDALPPGQAMRLSDGRKLAWSDSGHPRGHPVLLCHAFLHGQHDRACDDSFLRRLGIRLLIPERPGCGYSDPLEGGSIESWPSDIAQLLTHLGIAQFSVLGWSMGTPYAIALAQYFGARVLGLQLASPMFPIRNIHDLRHYSSQNRLFLSVGLYTPRLLPLLTAAVVRSIERDVFSFQETFYAKAPPAEKIIFDDVVYRQQRAQVLLQAARCGADAIAKQALEAFFHWQLQVLPKEIPCTIWHGEADPEVHRDAAKLLAQALGNVPLHLIKGAGHHVLLSHWRTIFQTIKYPDAVG